METSQLTSLNMWEGARRHVSSLESFCSARAHKLDPADNFDINQ